MQTVEQALAKLQRSAFRAKFGLAEVQINKIVALLMAWIERQLSESTQIKNGSS